MQLGMTLSGMDKVRDLLASLSGTQVRTAMAKALNDTAYQRLRPQMQQQMVQRFDRPTPFIVRSPRVFAATPDKPQVTVAPTYWSQWGTTGGKVGVDPQQVLQAQEQGGARRDKRSEVVLRRVGILPDGYQLVIPARPFPGSADGHGNLRGAFMVQLLSYFQSFGEQGWRGNMSDARRRNLARGGTASRLAKVAGPTLGRRYLVSYGRLRGGARMTRKGEPDARAGSLAPGIWAVLGNTGGVVRPVVMFTRKGMYKPRLDLQAIGRSADVQEYLARRVRFRIRQEGGV